MGGTRRSGCDGGWGLFSNLHVDHNGWITGQRLQAGPITYFSLGFANRGWSPVKNISFPYFLLLFSLH